MTEAWICAVPLGGLVWARCAGLLAVAPPLGWGPLPLVLRAAAAGVLSVPLTLVLHDPAQPVNLTAALYALALVREILLGLVLGAVVAVIVWGCAGAGHLTDMALIGDFGEETGPLARFFGILTVALFLLFDGHHWLVRLLMDSLLVVPPPAAGVVGMAGAEGIFWFSRFFVTVLGIAAPVLAAVLSAGLMAAALQRALAVPICAVPSEMVRWVVGIAAVAVVTPLLLWAVTAGLESAAYDCSRALALVRGGG